MAQPTSIIDAPSGETTRFGSQKVTFSTAGALIVEDISYKKGMETHVLKDENGKVYKTIHVAGNLGSGTMTVQTKAAGTKIAIGETTTFLETDGTVAYAVYVTGLGQEFHNGDVIKIPIDVSEKVN